MHGGRPVPRLVPRSDLVSSSLRLPRHHPRRHSPHNQPNSDTVSGPCPPRTSTAIVSDIRQLAGEIGPREATSANFGARPSFVERRLESLGYRVRRASVQVPAGNSWGMPVPAGRSVNVIAEPPRIRLARPHVVIGAHLDTVPEAPGAEDNASGVAVLLELARLAQLQPPEAAGAVHRLRCRGTTRRGRRAAPLRLAQRGRRRCPRPKRRAILAMVSLDRVGVAAGYVPVCCGGRADATCSEPSAPQPGAESTSRRGPAATGRATTGRTRRPDSRPSGWAASPYARLSLAPGTCRRW